MCELHVGATNHLDRLNNIIGCLLQTVLQLLANGQHGSGAEGVPGVHAHGVDVFNKTDCDKVVVGIAHDFELKLFPAQHAFFDQNLTHEAGGDSAFGNQAQFFEVINNTATGSPHGVCRTNHNRIPQISCDLFSIFDAIDGSAFRHFYAETIHRLLELNTVFSAFNGIKFHANYLDAVFVKDAMLGEGRGKV